MYRLTRNPLRNKSLRSNSHETMQVKQMNLTSLKKLTKLAVIPAVLVSASAFANIQGGPIMRLFPTTVLEDIGVDIGDNALIGPNLLDAFISETCHTNQPFVHCEASR